MLCRCKTQPFLVSPDELQEFPGDFHQLQEQKRQSEIRPRSQAIRDYVVFEGEIGVCGIAVLANFSCGISVILILNCGILQTCGMRFLYVLVDDFRFKNVFFTF